MAKHSPYPPQHVRVARHLRYVWWPVIWPILWILLAMAGYIALLWFVLPAVTRGV